jgi:hypothetical protein
MLRVCDPRTLLLLLPQLAAVAVRSVAVAEETLVIAAATHAMPAPCTGCGHCSVWVHSSYKRCVADEAVGGRPVRIELTVRRLYCENPDCPKVTFSEQVPGLACRYQRRTPALQKVVDTVALALAGSAGARLLAVLHQELSWQSVLNCLMRITLPARVVPEVIGIDEVRHPQRPALRHHHHRRRHRRSRGSARGPEHGNGHRMAARAPGRALRLPRRGGRIRSSDHGCRSGDTTGR